MSSGFTLKDSAGNTVEVTGDSFSRGAIGEFCFFAGTQAPSGYLVCDGSEVSQTAYPALYAYIGSLWGTASAGNFRLPTSAKDGKGYFLRGVGGESVGTYQDDVFKSHWHNYALRQGSGSPGINQSAGSQPLAVEHLTPTSEAGDKLETRPMSMTGLLCIKAFSSVASTQGVDIQGLIQEIQDMKARKGLATAWVNFDGRNGNIRDSFNVSSVTRTSAGEYSVNFTIPMTNVNYSPSVTVGTFEGFATGNYIFDLTENGFKIRCAKYDSKTGGNNEDHVYVVSNIFGGKA